MKNRNSHLETQCMKKPKTHEENPNQQRHPWRTKNPNHEDRKNKPLTAKAATIEPRQQRQAMATATAPGYDVSLWIFGWVSWCFSLWVFGFHWVCWVIWVIGFIKWSEWGRFLSEREMEWRGQDCEIKFVRLDFNLNEIEFNGLDFSTPKLSLLHSKCWFPQ